MKNGFGNNLLRSILKRNGFANVENSLGSMAACAPVGCPAVT